MRKPAVILLILSLFVQTTANVWLIGLFHWQRNFIAKNLCINRFDLIPICRGACFLQKQLNKEQEREKKEVELKPSVVTLCMNDIAIELFLCPIVEKPCYFPVTDTALLTGIPGSILRPPIG
ncbi:hypothetical protein [Chitinophaga pinensis]|uniref:Uncharacterized protein n=1 Tax=Chitinophaga pinensis TaxID=79329 RepID=A0A5C6LLM1_9BACT|nr:hypothetical protein [Chitinophaga pinensis]TWV95653.1 hypothetical protein FEF09_24455 [Chitinophaga pinensis]